MHFRNTEQHSKISLHSLQIGKELKNIKSKYEEIKAEVRGSLINKTERMCTLFPGCRPESDQLLSHRKEEDVFLKHAQSLLPSTTWNLW